LKKQADEAAQLPNFFKAVLYFSSFENIKSMADSRFRCW
jgi:hypothetical protein